MGTSWYDERTEPEQTCQGRLVAATPVTSPGGRTRLLYELEVDEDERLPIYGPDLEAELERRLGADVMLVGKVVDLTDEGFGIELWLGAVG